MRVRSRGGPPQGGGRETSRRSARDALRAVGGAGRCEGAGGRPGFDPESSLPRAPADTGCVYMRVYLCISVHMCAYVFRSSNEVRVEKGSSVDCEDYSNGI